MARMKKLKHDKDITISTGTSRKSRSWQEQTLKWSDFVKQLSETKRTSETQAEYFAMTKDRQDEIKDVGGYVGGKLNGGRRLASTVIDRILVTLDADFADDTFATRVKEVLPNALCIYSTHKHQPGKPRLRVVIPLDKAVDPVEYQAISRKLASKIGIDNFDDTTYEPHRLMYYPSTSKDAEYYFECQDGAFVSADAVLNEYANWKDRSQWAQSSRITAELRVTASKAEDPLLKQGIVGTFCRAHTIQDAIAEFLPEVYTEFGQDRYTYTGGSTAGGAVVYADKWLYSFHATDPCSLKLCNAFDLVRIHKFGSCDASKVYKDITRAPSYQKMVEFANADKLTQAQLMKENREKLSEDFDVVEDDSDEWLSKLSRKAKTGQIMPTRDNIRLILENDAKIKDCLGYDEFSCRTAIIKNPPWRKEPPIDQYWEDSDDAYLRHYVETVYGIESPLKIDSEILCAARKNKFHQVRDYLNSLTWDGTARIDTLLIDYLGADDTEYTRQVTRKMLIAAVGRVFQPGLKFDTMTILTGRQGIGKSYLIQKLGKSWYLELTGDLQQKDSQENIIGRWIAEMSELSALKYTKTLEAIKSFITRTEDNFRLPYARRAQIFKRQCIFIGTTNERIFLRDPTGNRRFLPIAVGVNEIDKNMFEESFDEVIDQVWAEAVNAWRNGESVWLGKDMLKVVEEVQARYKEEVVQVGMIEQYLTLQITNDWYGRSLENRRDFINNIHNIDEDDKAALQPRTFVSSAEIWVECFGNSINRFNSYEASKISTYMQDVDGWTNEGERTYIGGVYGYQRIFRRIEEKPVAKKVAEEVDDFDF